MSNEPERDIEKTLRAYARKRREDAGAPLELHPATRKLLQGEAARLAPKRSERPGFWTTMLAAFRPRIAMGAILAALAMTGVVVYNVSSNHTASSLAGMPAASTMQLAKLEATDKAPAANSAPAVQSMTQPQAYSDQPRSRAAGERRTDEDVTKDVAANQPIPTSPSSSLRKEEVLKELPTPAPVSAPAFVTAPGGMGGGGRGGGTATASANVGPTRLAAPVALGGTLTSSDTLSPAQAAEPAPVATFAGAAAVTATPVPDSSGGAGVPPAFPSGSPAAGPQSGSKVDHASGSFALAPQSAAAPAALPPAETKAKAAYGFGIAGSGSITQRFSQLRLATSASTLTTSTKSAKSQPVLETFRLVQAGNNLRVIDADGSVYTGVVQRAAAPAAPVFDTSAVAGQKEALADAKKTGAPTLALDGANRESATELFSFRVVGTNRTLRQRLVFTGSVLPGSQAIAGSGLIYKNGSAGGGGGGGGGGGFSPAPGAQLSSLLSQARIQGRAVVGSNEIQVNAVPALR